MPMPAEKSPSKNKGSRLIRFLILAALIAGVAVYLYVPAGSKDLPQVEAAPGEAVIQEPVTEQIENTQQSYVPEHAANAADVAQEAAVEISCAPAEAFEIFYANFKADEELRFARTRFPLLKRVFSGAGEEQTEEVFEIRKEQILSRDEMVYLDTVSASGYSEGIFANDPAQIDIRTGPEDSDPLTIHKFQQEAGCWFLYEFISYEYSGSNTILAL
jgi:hypothetical protein